MFFHCFSETFGWLVFGVNSPLRQYFSLYRAVSQREGEISETIRLDVSSESSARQRIHMKNQAVFSSKDKSKKLKCRLLQFLFGSLRVKVK